MADIVLTSTNLHVTFTSYKHSGPHPFTLDIPAQDRAVCPIRFMKAYTTLRGLKPGPLFMTAEGTPLSPSTFSSTLRLCLQGSGLSHLNISSHCFRLGRCTQLATLGYSEHHIKLIGRWRSDAFKRYVRIDALSCDKL